ncbi:MAG: hypothetical protein M1812_003164 [Candelaria pacifica]|nr:MAG: hypothetical protein M1812_003164 [Candelaria pacifica]
MTSTGLPTTSHGPPTPYLLKIPIEIRLIISEFVLIADTPYLIPVRQHRPGRSKRRTRSGRLLRPDREPDDNKYCDGHSAIAMLITCRQVYNEISAVYYRKNRFAFRDPICFKAFLNEIDPNNRAALRNIVLYDIGTRTNRLAEFAFVFWTFKLPNITLSVELPWDQGVEYVDNWGQICLGAMTGVRDVKICRPESWPRMVLMHRRLTDLERQQVLVFDEDIGEWVTMKLVLARLAVLTDRATTPNLTDAEKMVLRTECLAMIRHCTPNLHRYPWQYVLEDVREIRAKFLDAPQA